MTGNDRDDNAPSGDGSGLKRFSLVDNRALMGAIALNITGVILAFMLFQYLQATDGARALSRSRLVWEVILNLQILSAALVWFCYSDRIEGSHRQIRWLQHVRRWFAMVTVLLPTGLGLLGIQQNWFLEQPSAATVRLFAFVVLAYWLLGIWLHFLVQRRRRTRRGRAGLKYRALFLLPSISLVLIALVDAPSGGQFWLMAIPVLTYLQGSMPFLTKAFGLR